jgi:hypothetical protein
MVQRLNPGKEDFLFSKMASLACGLYPASYSLGTEVFPGSKAAACRVTVHLCLVPRLSISGALPHFPMYASMALIREAF